MRRAQSAGKQCRSCKDATWFPSCGSSAGCCCGRRRCACHHPCVSQVGFEWTACSSSNRALHRSFLTNQKRSGNQASNFYMSNSLRQEVKDGNGSRLSIYSHRRFDSRQSCESAADDAFLTPDRCRHQSLFEACVVRFAFCAGQVRVYQSG